MMTYQPYPTGGAANDLPAAQRPPQRVWMAWANDKGSNWARVVATVLFGLNTISLIFSLGRASITIIFVGLGWLAGLVGTVFLWPKDTSAYISSRPA
jgi:hypothetical protein